MDLFRVGFLRFGIVDLIDILVVAYIIYRLLLLMKGTRSAQIFVGLMLVGAVSFLAFWFQLEGLKWLFTNLATVGFIVLVVVFQPELRGALAQIGHSQMFRVFFKLGPNPAVDEIVRGAERLTELGWGALIVLEREVGLRNVAETGKTLDARLSAEMLVTIFTPHSPLHDGAVIVSGETIAAAACTLPLTINDEYADLFGMRHKAAVGITEDSDAIVVVVSEETRRISLAHRGRLYRNIALEHLKENMVALMGP
ncbi:MAG: diadenylate cyclase CdaA [Candidatus Zixiibacteriota bacterium]